MNTIQFGSYNTVTKQSSEGYIENNEMKFKPYPWYKKMWFRIKETRNYNLAECPPNSFATEYIGTTTLYSKMIWSNHKNYFETAVYRKYCIVSNDTLCIYSNIDGHRKVYFNVDAYKQENKLILD